MTNKKTVVVYYSLSGNTRRIAQHIADALDADTIEIKTIKPYVGTYDEIVDQGQREAAASYTPDIEPIDISKYDRVIVGSPTWWYKMAPAVLSFVRGTKFSGKDVEAFSTHAGWAGSVVRDISNEMTTRGGVAGHPIEIQFDGDKMHTPQSSVDKWIDGLK